MSLVVEDVMARDVVTINSDFTAKYAARMMINYGISSVIVLSKGKVAGILTERDVMKRVIVKGMDPDKTLVNEIMSHPVMVVGPTTPLVEAVKLMVEKQIKKLPVMNEESKDAELIGVLSLNDIARIQPMLLESIRELTQLGATAPEIENEFFVR
ncbi:MAG TPA: CBS domain-containing protein [Patescibacteria group bacterium]|nr:CBS domain-containing protein [Patescibacteria group bacterium]